MSGSPRSSCPAARVRTALAFIAVALSAPWAASPAQETRPGPESRPGSDFVYEIPPEGITLEQLAHEAEVATGRTFLLSDKSPIKGKTIRFSGQARVPRDQVLSLFQALFVTQGYALKPMGEATNRILVVESIDTSVDLKQRSTFVRPEEIDAYRNEVGTVVMTFFPLKHVRLQNVRAALSQILTSKAVEVTLDVESANAMIVIGFAPTVFAMKQIIAVMDVPQNEVELRFELISLKHAVAEELEPIILNLIDANPGGQPGRGRGAAQGLPQFDKPPPKVIADPRLNSFAVYAVASDLEEIRNLIGTLDLEVTGPSQNLRIYRLQNTNAEDMADLLSETYGFQRPGGARGSRPSRSGASGAAAGRATGGSRNDDVQIVAEPLNNALIIRASKTRYETVEPLIRALDRLRPQVMIEGAVAELTDTQLKAVGSEIAALDGGSGRYHPGAVTGFGLSTLSIAAGGSITGGGAGSGTGTGGGMGGGGVSQTGDPDLVRIPFFPGNSGNPGGGVFGIFNDALNVPLLITMLQNGRFGNLITTPVVVANDNAQSTIESSRQVATQTFQAGAQVAPGQPGFGGQGADTTSFGGYQEAKISLTISPHISSDDYVRLEVELLVEAFLPPTDTRPGIPPDKTSRKLVGSVTLRNGQTVVVGGLLLADETQQQDGVPPFADQPLIGELFRLRGRQAERASIYFFLTPTIISSFETLDHVSYEKKLEVLKLQGPVKLLDPEFRPIPLDHRWIGIDLIEASGNLDVPRYSAVVPLTECGPGEKPRDGGSRDD